MECSLHHKVNEAKWIAQFHCLWTFGDGATQLFRLFPPSASFIHKKNPGEEVALSQVQASGELIFGEKISYDHSMPSVTFWLTRSFALRNT